MIAGQAKRLSCFYSRVSRANRIVRVRNFEKSRLVARSPEVLNITTENDVSERGVDSVGMWVLKECR